LTAHGISQANELAERLLVVEPPIERVYSSMYYRCLQTVEPFVRKAQAPNTTATGGSSAPLRIRGETGLGEWYGSAEFAHPTPASLETLRLLFPDLLEPDYRPAVTPNRMGEGIDELHDRVAAAVDAVIAECDRDGVRAVLLCTHAAVIIALGRVLTGEMPDDVEVEDFRAFTCGLSLYRRRRQQVSVTETSPLGWRGGRGIRGGWDCELNSDCTHLSLGEERGW
jgi:transcription factor C subunit 7